jgi:nicotinamidase-related amidase
MGVNTNSCVIATGIAASVRDFAVFLIEDGIDSMLGKQLHDAARDVFAASFGWIVSGEAVVNLLGERVGRSGGERPEQM